MSWAGGVVRFAAPVAGLVALGVPLAGCGAPGPVEVDIATPSGAARTACERLIAALPDNVAGQDRRDVTPSDAPASAWGDPAIVLRCGVARPAALKPASSCYVVNGVGWLATQDGKAVSTTRPIDGTLDFTTIGRSVYVEVTVPEAYQPQADALVDVAAAVASSTTDLHPCQ
jgi:hypothetical protein